MIIQTYLILFFYIIKYGINILDYIFEMNNLINLIFYENSNICLTLQNKFKGCHLQYCFRFD